MGDPRERRLLGTAAFVAWKHKGKIVLAFLFVMAVTTAGLLVVRPDYDSTAKLLVKGGRDRLALVPAESKEAQVFRTKEEVINSEVAILRSEYLRRKVIEVLGPDVLEVPPRPPRSVLGRLRYGAQRFAEDARRWLRDLLVRSGVTEPLSPFDEAMEKVERGLLVAPVRKADVIELTMRTPSPEVSARVLGTLIALYLERHTEIHQTPGAYEFFDAQAAELKRALEEAEARLHRFRTERGLVSLEEQKRILLGQVADARAALDRTRRELAETSARVARIRADLAGLAQSVSLSEVRSRNPVLDALENRLVELRLQREKLAARFLPDARQVQDIDAEIARLQELQRKSREEYVSSVTSGQNVTYKELEKTLLVDEARLTALGASERKQAQTLRDYEQRLRALAAEEMTLARLTRAVNEQHANYEVYRKGLEERRVEREMDRERIVQVSVIEPATRPIAPAGAGKLVTLGAGALTGLLLGALLAIVAERYDATFWRSEDLERAFQVPVVAAVPDARD